MLRSLFVLMLALLFSACGGGGGGGDTTNNNNNNNPPAANYDVAVVSLSAPGSANAGDDLLLSAEVTNLGDILASPGVTFYLSIDPDLSLVAELNGRIVGHVVLSRIKLVNSSGEHEILALGPMSVVPSQSHRGIGTELIDAAIARARALCYGAIVVAGHPDYYQRFGFKPASSWSVTSNLAIPDDALTAMELADGALAGGGEARYPDLYRKLF